MGLLALTKPEVANAQTDKNFARGSGVDYYGSTFRFKTADRDSDPTTFQTRKRKSTFYLDGGDYTLQGKLTCLHVVGNRAFIQGKIAKATGTFAGQEGLFAGFDVADVSSSGEGDIFQFASLSDTKECRAPAAGGSTIRSGDVEVHDVGLT